MLDPLFDVVRRGLELPSLDGYRIGQHLLLSAWTEVVLETVSDTRTALEVSRATSNSLSDFVSSTMRVLLEEMTTRRDEALHD
ncbi:hypothetical protein C6A85_45900, partial [Mycobacterium sp. ITM-2017-0098]